MDIQTLIEVVKLTPDFHHISEPATLEEIQEVESELGFKLPDELTALYLYSNGLGFCGGDLVHNPLQSSEFYTGITKLKRLYMDGEWPIPDEVFLFGSDGCGDPFGLWLPDVMQGRQNIRVVKAGRTFSPSCMAVAGSSIIRFLYGYLSYYLMDEGEKVLDLLGLPGELRTDPTTMGDEEFEAIIKWADPDLPFHNIDAYEQELSLADLKKLFEN